MSTPGDTMRSVGYIMSTAGVFSTPGDTMRKLGGYHDECGGGISKLGDVQYTGVSIQIQLLSQ